MLSAAALLAPHYAAAQGVTAPQIASPPAVTSNPSSGDTYGTDDSIAFTVTFGAAVTATGAPRFGFRLKDSGEPDSADNFKLAALAGGSGTTSLRFTYNVQPGDGDDDGISIGSGSETFQLDSGDAIRDAATNSVDADLAHAAPGTQSGHKVKGLPRAPANFRLEPVTGTNLRLIWNDPHDPSITLYQFRLRLAEEEEWRPDWTDVTGSDASTTRLATQNLAGGVRVVVELRAVNRHGHGPAAQATGTSPGGSDPNPPPPPDPPPPPPDPDPDPEPDPDEDPDDEPGPGPGPEPVPTLSGAAALVLVLLLTACGTIARRVNPASGSGCTSCS